MPDKEILTEGEALECIQKFATDCYTRGIRDGGIATMIGVGVGGCLAVGWYLFVEWREDRKNHKH